MNGTVKHKHFVKWIRFIVSLIDLLSKWNGWFFALNIVYLISKSRISSDVIVLVTSSNCRIFSSRFFFFSPELLPSFCPCSTLMNSPSFFRRKTSTALSRLSDGFTRFPIITVDVLRMFFFFFGKEIKRNCYVS